jgi:hypothetical protein
MLRSPRKTVRGPGILGFVEEIIWLTQKNEIWLAKYGDR